jgi:hypothetical protein
VTITKINKTCVVKEKIQVEDQLTGVDDDYFLYFLTRDLVQFIKNKQFNPVRILTFQLYKKDKIWDIRVIPTAQEQIPCQECTKGTAVSYCASHLNPNQYWNLCEGCRVNEFRGFGGLCNSASNVIMQSTTKRTKSTTHQNQHTNKKNNTREDCCSMACCQTVITRV